MRISRRRHYTGQPVTVTRTDGTTVTGTIRGWGTLELTLNTPSGFVRLSTVHVSRVDEN
jgi:hypothetical protein